MNFPFLSVCIDYIVKIKKMEKKGGNRALLVKLL